MAGLTTMTEPRIGVPRGMATRPSTLTASRNVNQTMSSIRVDAVFIGVSRSSINLVPALMTNIEGEELPLSWAVAIPTTQAMSKTVMMTVVVARIFGREQLGSGLR